MSPSDVLDPVRSDVARLARGRRALRFATAFWRLSFWGLLAVAAAAWWLGLQTTLVVAAAVLGAAVLGAAVFAAWRRVDLIAVAKRYDDTVGTKDLVSSALELEDRGQFAELVRSEAATATGRATAREIYPQRLPRETRWLPVPLAGIALALLIPILTAPAPRLPAPDWLAAVDRAAALLEDLKRRPDLGNAVDTERLKQLQALADQLRREGLSKKDALAEIAKLAAQLDKERRDLEAKKLQVEQKAARLASGEENADAKQDIDGGRYREAANKVKKKIEELQKKIEELKKRGAAKAEIERLEEQLRKLQELLALLENLDAVGRELGFRVEELDTLDRIEGVLGEVGEYDGPEWDELQPGERQKRAKREEQEGEEGQPLLMPTDEWGRGHVKKVLGDASRALTEREQKEAKLREGKGKSSFGQLKTANDRSKSSKQYRETVLASQRAAEDAIYRQNIPIGYRSYIRRYFELMQPDEPRAETPNAESPESGK